VNPGKYVVFALDGERFGLPIERVERILPAQSVTRIPKTSRELLGVFDLRGSTLPVVDTRALLEFEEGERGCFVVVLADDRRIALTADRVDCIANFEAKEIEFSEELGTYVGKQADRLTLLSTPEEMIPQLLLERAIPA